MNVVVEHQPNCLVTLQIEVPAERVSQEWEKVVKEFQKHASVPGYRKGFTPKKIIETRFAKEVRKELQDKLPLSILGEAVESEKLEAIAYLGFENIELEKDRPLRFTAKIATTPVFELPPYTGIELEILPPVVTEKDVMDVLESIRKSRVQYEPIEGRGLEMGDLAVLNYTTHIEGKPVVELAPDAPKLLFGKKNLWFRLEPDAMAPGFSEAMVGMKPGETRHFEAPPVPLDHITEALRGKKIEFEISLESINKEIFPELSDEFINTIFPGRTLEETKANIWQRLKEDAEEGFIEQKRQKLIEHLLSQVQIASKVELPNHLVSFHRETFLQMFYEEGRRRGMKPSEVHEQEEKISHSIQKQAENRVLRDFLLLKIAAKEKIQVTENDLLKRLNEMAQEYKMPLPKLIRDLKQKNAISSIREEVLLNKALDFVVDHAAIHEPAAVLPSATSSETSPSPSDTPTASPSTENL